MKLFVFYVLSLAALPKPTCAETINVLVILVQWANHDDRTLIPKEHIEQLWNGPRDADIAPGEFVSAYIESNSYGKYDILAEVVDWYRVPQTEQETSNGKMGNSVDGKDIEDVLVPVLEAAVEGGVDLSKYDRRGDKKLRGKA
jgi:M6 family metalloprotease-like protein